MHVVQSALAGAHVATIPFKVIQQLVKHPLTDKGLEAFLKDWEKWQSNAKELEVIAGHPEKSS